MNLRKPEKPFSLYVPFLVCFVTAFAAVTICSKSSFLYPFNDWVDANCFFTVGKSIRAGLVPYRDLFEQKGPLLYFLYMLASLVSNDTFIGVYLIEIISGTFFLYYSYKTMELYCGRKALYCVPFVALAVYTCIAFAHGGSAEELCFPLMAAPLYIFLKAVKAHGAPSPRESFAIGVCSACVFWSKFTLIGMFPGWFLVFAVDMLVRRKAKDLLKTALWIFLGVAAGTLPWVAYFGANHAIGDWLEAYLYDNLILYSKVTIGSGRVALSDMWENFLNGWQNLAENNLPAVILVGAAGLYCVVRRRIRVLLYGGVMVLAAYFFCYVGGRAYTYYSLGFAPFVCLGFVPVVRILSGINEKRRIFTRWLCIGYALVAAAAVFLTPNRYLMGVDRAELPQYRFAAIISETPDATLLNFDFLDGGFYTTAGIVPNCRAFCALNIPLPELRGQQIDFLRDGVCDYVVTRNEELKGIDLEKYELADSCRYVLEGKMWTYRLYKRTASAVDSD